jgi:1-acyl-sn-glycerol-3-phosphate acyltransferase
VFIRGTYEAMPRGKALRRLEQVTIIFGEPLDPHDFERQGRGARSQDSIARALRDRVAELDEHS